MTEHSLIRRRVISHRWITAIDKVLIGNRDHRAKSVSPHIGSEKDWHEVTRVIHCIDGHIIDPLVAANLRNKVTLIDRWRQFAGHSASPDWIHGQKGSFNIEETNLMFAFDQTD